MPPEKSKSKHAVALLLSFDLTTEKPEKSHFFPASIMQIDPADTKKHEKNDKKTSKKTLNFQASSEKKVKKRHFLLKKCTLPSNQEASTIQRAYLVL